MLDCRCRVLLFSLLLLLFCMSALATVAQAADFEVFLIGGQSNATGRGDSSQLTGTLAAPQTDVYFYWHQGLAATNAALADDTLLALQPGSGHGTYGTVNPNEFGPELGFGRSMADAFPDHNIFIIKYAYGGSNLHTDWSAGGAKYATFLDTTAAGLAAITSAGHTVHMAGMLWQQGEADQSAANAAAYEANLTDLISRVRTDAFGGQADAPFVLGTLSTNQTNYDQSPGSGFQVVRTAQANVAAADTAVAAVNTDTYSVRADNVHFDASGQVDLGAGLAAAMIPLVSFNAPSGKAPPAPVAPLSAATFGTTGVYDESVVAANQLDKATPAGSLPTFKAAIAAARAAGAGGVIDFDADFTATPSSGGTSNNPIDAAFAASFGTTGEKRLNLSSTVAFDVYTNDVNSQVHTLSGHNALITRHPTVDFDLALAIEGGGADEHVVEFGVSLLQRTTYTANQTMELTALYSDGGSESLSLTITGNGGRGSSDAFFHFAAPDDQWITGVEFRNLTNNGITQSRMVLEDIGFVTEIVPEPGTLVLLVVGGGLALLRRRRG